MSVTAWYTWQHSLSSLQSDWKRIQSSSDPMKTLLVESDPLFFSFSLCLFFAFSSWLVSVIKRNYSQVDKLWSITPVIYAWWFAYKGDWAPRPLLMTVLITLWGVRLTYNFSRVGGYSGVEDYRWKIVRDYLASPFLWHIFNVIFVAFYQHLLLYLITLPVYLAAVNPKREERLSLLDFGLACLFLVFWVGEALSDNQQFNFQTEKYRRKNKGEKLTGDYAKGFRTSGLFRFSRHPNYFCELSMWVTQSAFCLAATGSPSSWTQIGAGLLILLFQGSTALTESITASKYPQYKDYQKTTSRLIPWFPGKQKRQ